MAVVNRIGEILKERGIKQTWLASKCNLHRGTMHNIISNKYNTSLEVSLKIAKVLDLKVEEIFELVLEESNCLTK